MYIKVHLYFQMTYIVCLWSWNIGDLSKIVIICTIGEEGSFEVATTEKNCALIRSSSEESAHGTMRLWYIHSNHQYTWILVSTSMSHFFPFFGNWMHALNIQYFIPVSGDTNLLSHWHSKVATDIFSSSKFSCFYSCHRKIKETSL